MSANALQFVCPGCQTKLKVPDTARGKTIACPRCQTRLKIPSAAGKPSAGGTGARQASGKPSRPTTGPVRPAPSPLSKTASSAKTASSTKMASSANRVRHPGPSAVSTGNESATPNRTAGLNEGAEWDDVAAPAEDFFGGLDLPPAVVPSQTLTQNPISVAAAAPSSKHPGSSEVLATPKIDLGKAIEQQLAEPIKVHRSSAGYRWAMALVSLFMMAMPIAYVGLVVLACWGVFHYTFDIFPSLISAGRIGRGRVMAFLMLLYVTPIIAGLTTVLFMIKPLFITMVGFGKERTRSLTREAEPLLFDLVDRICEATGSPKPKRIDIDAQANASASYGAGFRAIFRRELILTIGVPLVAGLDTRQFVGVLTHEFGHFSQGAGMRARIIILSINAWFAKVVYHRDAIDETLDEMIEDSESALVFVLLIARFCVMLVRGVLWCFMFAAHVASSLLSRQMEFDADRYEIAMVGSETFASTEGEFHLMSHSFGKALETVAGLLRQAVMIDDVPRMVQVCRTTLDADEKRTLWESLTSATTGVFDTHPCPRARIAAAEKLAVDGQFTLQRPARELFAHYDAMCRNVTQDFYRNAVGRLINPSELEPVDRHLHLVLAKRG